MRVLVCGGRDYADSARVFATLDFVAAEARDGTGNDDTMTKPHEETWTAEYGRCDPDDRGSIDIWHVNFPDHYAVYLYDDEPRAKLIAQAPAMARLLLELHTEGKLTRSGSRSCPVCESTWRERITGKDYAPSHYDHCELATVLRAAGVLP